MTDADLAILADRLAQAQRARHLLVTGQAAVEVREDDRLVKFTSADQGRLETYIDALKTEIAEAGGVRAPRRAPIHLTF